MLYKLRKIANQRYINWTTIKALVFTKTETNSPSTYLIKIVQLMLPKDKQT